MILIVDDTQENLYSLKTLLQLHKFEVDTASSGEEALKKVLLQSYSLMILDVQMPGMDGFEVAQAITSYSRTRNLPIIFLSAVHIEESFLLKGFAAGAVDYITKPFNPEVLILKVQTFQRIHEQHLALQELTDSLQKEIESRKQAQQALFDMNERLEEKVAERTRALTSLNNQLRMSNEELQQYAFVASHDLQEPLRKIITFGNRLNDMQPLEEEKARQYIDKIVQSSERMRSLIRDLLEYSVLNEQLAFESTSLNALFEECRRDLELLIEERRAVITVGDLGMAEVVPAEIKQVFLNLLSNAIKFTEPGTAPKINVTGNVVEEEHKGPLYLQINFTDNGIGFDDSQGGKIFDLFQRLNTKDYFPGNGIGLSIVRKIVERHGGTCTAVSTPGTGSTFTIRLPLVQQPGGTDQHKPRIHESI